MPDERERATTLVFSRISDRVGVLGPGTRAVVWVHGCPLRCAGCIAPQDLPFEGGQRAPIEQVTARLNSLNAEITGVTFSGGEPMAQAGALANLIDLLREKREWSVLSYTGYTLNHLRRHGTREQRAMLDRLDILIDGPYLAARHADLLWRGSENQRIHRLTDRHPELAEAEDHSAGIELEIDPETSRLAWTGVPPVPGFRERFEATLEHAGIGLTAARD
jgi:anaerobic ribonucleoside-triphosphate reductase activating protein